VTASIADLRAGLFAARLAASKAYEAKAAPARAKFAKAAALARAAGLKKVDREALTAYVTAMHEASASWHAHVDEPEAALDRALAQSKEISR
jgi:hypothetical protein